nr:PREDICTED: nuclear pore complex protein Nup214 [Linepithema humile]
MKTALDPVYVQDFLFKQSNTSQVFDFKIPTYIPPACSLLVADKKRGLLYVGHDDKITVLKPAEENNPEWKIELQLPGIISKIAINCDYNYIAIAVALKPTILIYDAHSLARNSLILLLEITSSNKLDSYVTDIRWNPTVPAHLCTITSDCTIGSFQLKVEEEVRENSIPKVSVLSKVSNEPQALCASWSPKGKQIAVGCRNGDIVQLRPDTLKVARTIAGPSPFIGEIISLLWISNYQFCAAYVNNERNINVLIVDAPRGETNAIFTCYEDITYGYPDADGEGNAPRYYFEHVPEWGLIMAGSGTSSDIAVLGTVDGGVNWNQWQLIDSGRALLPLIRTTEVYPIGLAVDKSPTNKLLWSAESTLPHPVPILHILGTFGRLCSFHMVNLSPNCHPINSPPTEIVTAPPPSQPSALPEMSFNINTAVTSTPRPKQSEIMPERPKPAVVTNIFGDSLKAAGFFQQPVEQPAEQPKLQEEKPAPITIIKPIVPKEPPPEPAKPEIRLAVDNKEASSPQVVERRASIDDSIRMRAYLQEQALFEKELRNRLEPQVWECGTLEEKKRLSEITADIEDFLRELNDTTNGLSTDIACLKALLLQSFAWVEETKSKNAASADTPCRNCSENNKIADLKRCFYYMHTQLGQISKMLDLEWSEQKAREKSKMKIPSLEYVYQNLLMYSRIIAKQNEKTEQTARLWKSCKCSLGYSTVVEVASLDRSMASLHLNTPKSPATTMRGKTDVIDARCKAIAKRTLCFTHEKQVKLKALLTESPPRIIKSINPSPVQDRLKATLSSLASHSSAVTQEAKTKTEPPIVKQNTTVKQTVEKQIKSQSPLASLNSIVARIGSSDTNGAAVQNKTQQKPLPATVSFSTTISTKQTDKKPTVPTVTPMISQSKPKQEPNVGFPSSITFGTSAAKPQEILFPKSPLMDATARSNKELTTNDGVPRAAESALFSTGLLKDVLSTEYPLSDTARIVRNLPSLSAAPVVKTDAASTFSFAGANIVPSVAKSSSSGTALDTVMSFAYAKSAQPTVESSIAQAPIQTMDFSALSLGSASALTLQSANLLNNTADVKLNAPTTSMSFAVSEPVITAQAPTVAATTVAVIGGITISLADTRTASNVERKSTEMPFTSPVAIEKITPEKAPGFGIAAAQAAPTSLSAAPIFSGQTVIKNMVPEVTTTPSTTTTFGAAAFPSIAPTFGTSTSAPTASVFSSFANAPSAATPSSSTTPASGTVSPFQSSLNKATFGDTAATSMPATSYGISSGNTSAGTISFATAAAVATTSAAVSITPAFGKSLVGSPVSNAQFSNVQQTPASTANVFTKPILSPPSTLFGGTSGSVFSNIPATSPNTSIFGGSSGGSSSNMNSIFAPSTPLPPPSGDIFGGNTGFGTSGSIFDTNTPKPGNMFGGATNTAPIPFGNTMSNASPTATGASPTGGNVFSRPAAGPNTSPIQQSVLGNQPAFGQAPAFGAKPVFGSSPVFGGSKTVFGGSSFGTFPTFEPTIVEGFGNQPAMQGGSTMENMPKVFGEVASNSMFESLANQPGGLSFGSLAQKNPEPEKPTFTAGSSFSSWR